MIRRLRIKFVCINMAIVTLLLGGIFALVLYFTKANIERESMGMLQAIAADPTRLGRPGEAHDGLRLPYFILELDGEGGVEDAWGGYYDLTDEEFLESLATLASGHGDGGGVLEDYGLRYFRVWARGTQYLIFSDMSSEWSIIQNLVRSCLLIGALGFAAFLVVSFLLARWAVRPVALAWEKQRQFVADASHELKTPLTVILSNAQLLGDDASDPATRQRLTENILSMSTRMRGLAEDLLELARVDDVPARPGGEYDLSRLVGEAVLPFEPLFYERGLALESDIEPGIRTRGDAEGVTRVIGILLDNAQKYSSPGGRALVCLRRAGCGHCLLTVENPGEPLSPQELRDIFKRFYRADAARCSSGYGLGLAIAKGIVEAQRGKLWAEATQGGNRFCVKLKTTRAARQ